MKGIAATQVAALSLWLLPHIVPCSVAYTYEHGWVITNSTCSGGASCKKCVERGCSHYKCQSKLRHTNKKKTKRTYKDICGTPSRYRGGNTKPPGFENYASCSENATQGQCRKTRGTGLIVGGCILGLIGLVMCCPAYDWVFSKWLRAADTGGPKEEQLSVLPAAYGTTDGALGTQNPVFTISAGRPPVDDTITRALVDNDAGAIQVNEATPVQPSAAPSTSSANSDVCGLCCFFTMMAGFLTGSITMLYFGVKLQQS